MRPAPYGRRLLLAIMTVAAGHWTRSAQAESELGVADLAAMAADGWTALLERYPVRWNQFDGGKTAFRAGAARSAMWASGERRDEPERPVRPTEGRVLLRRGVVAPLCRCSTSPYGARLATAQNHPGQMVPSDWIAL